MKNRSFLALVLVFLSCGLAQAQAPERVGDVLGDRTIDWRNPAERARAVGRMRVAENANRERARLKADAMGIPMRRELPDGTVQEIVGLDEEDNFIIYTTHNANAAISTAANLLHAEPYGLDGSGVTVGVWDEGAVRETHTEFQTGSGSRVTRKDGADLSNHGTHVGGTIGARGASASHKGMAPNVLIDSYDWNDDSSDMAERGATGPGQADRLYISNHSYGIVSGWRSSVWYGTGTDQNAYEARYGQYSGISRNWDIVAFNAPYYLIFTSAGNSNNQNPSQGALVTIGGSQVYYDRAIHPPGNGLYRNTTTDPANGHENITAAGIAKNVVTVGAADDAVVNGQRDPSKSTLALFSSRGPTDDGRIKPDIVANGVSLSSTGANHDAHYYGASGTSMSSPNAAGSAALLVQLYRDLFDGGDMRASTLKGLLIHTATDLGAHGLGNPGPDYHYGWGLINVQKAADLILDQHANPGEPRIIEDQLTTSVSSVAYSFNWEGVSPIRATLCWTDPAGAATNAHDSRTSRLVNDLDLKLIAPDETEYFPFVMPFVGTWTVESMSLPATTGVNSTDNVEQVLIENPAQSGAWQVVVTHKGSLTNNQQHYSLLLDGLTSIPHSMEVDRGGAGIVVGGVDGVGGTGVGAGSQLTYTIANVGGGLLELATPVTISGQSNCAVTVNTQPAGTVPGGEGTSLVLVVTPAAEGAWSFGVSIDNNDPDKDPYHWTVTGVAGEVSSGETTLTAAADTYIDSLSAGGNFGTETTIRLNNQSAGQPQGRLHLQGLLRFDLSVIPTTATILSAKLDFVQDNDRSVTFGIREATGSWGETDATWNNSSTLFGSTSYGSATTGTTAGAAVPTITLNASGLSKVQSWVSNPSGNHGFGIIANEMGNTTAYLALRSREYATEAHRPRLTVEYDGGVDSTDAPLMVLTRASVLINNGGTDSISETKAGVGEQLTYAIGNLGDADLLLTTPVTISGESNCSVSVSTQPASPVAPSGSTDLVLTVTPTAGGSWSATVSIATNDADKDPYTWTISGSALGWFTVTYHANNADSGSAPVDPDSPYELDSVVTVLGPGDLVKSDHLFDGWNTAADGTGTGYAPDATFVITDDTTLYAQWILEAPDAPTDLVAEGKLGQIELTWSVSENTVSSTVKRSTSSGGPYTEIGTTTGTTYDDTAVEAVVRYYYVVAAVNAAGASEDSSEASAMLPAVVPFTEGFESLTLGDLDGQRGWVAQGAEVQSEVTFGGSDQAGAITEEGGFMRISFADAQTKVWTDMRLQVVYSPEAPVPDVDATVVVFVAEGGEVMVYDGDAIVATGLTVVEGDWARFTILSDYTEKTWRLYVNEARTGPYGFFDTGVPGYAAFHVRGGGTQVDDIAITLDRPPMGESATVIIVQ